MRAIRISLLLLCFLSCAAVLNSKRQLADASRQTAIREVLLQLYSSTSGAFWIASQTGVRWGSSDDPCTWAGVVCCVTQNGSQAGVLSPTYTVAQVSRPCTTPGEPRALLLRNRNLTGALPPSLASLSLEVIILADNPGLHGQLLPSLLLLASLVEIDLRNTSLTCPKAAGGAATSSSSTGSVGAIAGGGGSVVAEGGTAGALAGTGARAPASVACQLPAPFLPSLASITFTAGAPAGEPGAIALAPAGALYSCPALAYRNASVAKPPSPTSSLSSAAAPALAPAGSIIASGEASRASSFVELAPPGAAVLLADPWFYLYQSCICLQLPGDVPAALRPPALLLQGTGGSLTAVCEAFSLAVSGQQQQGEGGGPDTVTLSEADLAGIIVGVALGAACLSGLAVMLCCARRELRQRRRQRRHRAGGASAKGYCGGGGAAGGGNADDGGLRGVAGLRLLLREWLQERQLSYMSDDRRNILTGGGMGRSHSLSLLMSEDLTAAGGRKAMPASEFEAKRARPPGSLPELFGNEVALVATDVEGSTELWEWQPDIMNSALALHDRLLRLTLAACCGYEVTTEGDAFLVAFHEPVDAVRWALLLQSALLKLDWPPLLLEHPLCRPRPLVPIGTAGSQGSGAAVASGAGSGGANDAPLLVLFKGLAVRMGIATGVPSAVREHPVTRRMQYTGAVLRLATGIAELGAGGQVLLEPLTFKRIHTKFEELDVEESEVQELVDIIRLQYWDGTFPAPTSLDAPSPVSNGSGQLSPPPVSDGPPSAQAPPPSGTAQQHTGFGYPGAGQTQGGQGPRPPGVAGGTDDDNPADVPAASAIVPAAAGQAAAGCEQLPQPPRALRRYGNVRRGQSAAVLVRRDSFRAAPLKQTSTSNFTMPANLGTVPTLKYGQPGVSLPAHISAAAAAALVHSSRLNLGPVQHRGSHGGPPYLDLMPGLARIERSALEAAAAAGGSPVLEPPLGPPVGLDHGLGAGGGGGGGDYVADSPAGAMEHMTSTFQAAPQRLPAPLQPTPQQQQQHGEQGPIWVSSGGGGGRVGAGPHRVAAQGVAAWVPTSTETARRAPGSGGGHGLRASAAGRMALTPELVHRSAMPSGEIQIQIPVQGQGQGQGLGSSVDHPSQLQVTMSQQRQQQPQHTGQVDGAAPPELPPLKLHISTAHGHVLATLPSFDLASSTTTSGNATPSAVSHRPLPPPPAPTSQDNTDPAADHFRPPSSEDLPPNVLSRDGARRGLHRVASVSPARGANPADERTPSPASGHGLRQSMDLAGVGTEAAAPRVRPVLPAVSNLQLAHGLLGGGLRRHCSGGSVPGIIGGGSGTGRAAGGSRHSSGPGPIAEATEHEEEKRTSGVGSSDAAAAVAAVRPPLYVTGSTSASIMDEDVGRTGGGPPRPLFPDRTSSSTSQLSHLSNLVLAGTSASAGSLGDTPTSLLGSADGGGGGAGSAVAATVAAGLLMSTGANTITTLSLLGASDSGARVSVGPDPSLRRSPSHVVASHHQLHRLASMSTAASGGPPGGGGSEPPAGGAAGSGSAVISSPAGGDHSLRASAAMMAAAAAAASPPPPPPPAGQVAPAASVNAGGGAGGPSPHGAAWLPPPRGHPPRSNGQINLLAHTLADTAACYYAGGGGGSGGGGGPVHHFPTSGSGGGGGAPVASEEPPGEPAAASLATTSMPALAFFQPVHVSSFATIGNHPNNPNNHNHQMPYQTQHEGWRSAVIGGYDAMPTVGTSVAGGGLTGPTSSAAATATAAALHWMVTSGAASVDRRRPMPAGMISAAHNAVMPYTDRSAAAGLGVGAGGAGASGMLDEDLSCSVAGVGMDALMAASDQHDPTVMGAVVWGHRSDVDWSEGVGAAGLEEATGCGRDVTTRGLPGYARNVLAEVVPTSVGRMSGGEGVGGAAALAAPHPPAPRLLALRSTMGLQATGSNANRAAKEALDLSNAACLESNEVCSISPACAVSPASVPHGTRERLRNYGSPRTNPSGHHPRGLLLDLLQRLPSSTVRHGVEMLGRSRRSIHAADSSTGGPTTDEDAAAAGGGGAQRGGVAAGGSVFAAGTPTPASVLPFRSLAVGVLPSATSDVEGGAARSTPGGHGAPAGSALGKEHGLQAAAAAGAAAGAAASEVGPGTLQPGGAEVAAMSINIGLGGGSGGGAWGGAESDTVSAAASPAPRTPRTPRSPVEGARVKELGSKRAFIKSISARRATRGPHSGAAGRSLSRLRFRGPNAASGGGVSGGGGKDSGGSGTHGIGSPRSASHSLIVIDMGVHRLKISALGAVYGDLYDGVQVIQILPEHLKHRAAYHPPLKSQAQLAPSFFDAPGASQALLPCALGQAPSLPRLSLMFIQPAGYSAVANSALEVAERSGAVFAAAVREVLALLGAYECQEYECTFMVACQSPRVAAEVALALHEWLLHADWPTDLLEEHPEGRVQLAPDGRPLLRGFRAKVGIFTGVPLSVVPHATTGRADYFGALVNRAARLMAGAKAGQTLIDKASGVEVLKEWRQLGGGAGGGGGVGGGGGTLGRMTATAPSPPWRGAVMAEDSSTSRMRPSGASETASPTPNNLPSRVLHNSLTLAALPLAGLYGSPNAGASPGGSAAAALAGAPPGIRAQLTLPRLQATTATTVAGPTSPTGAGSGGVGLGGGGGTAKQSASLSTVEALAGAPPPYQLPSRLIRTQHSFRSPPRQPVGPDLSTTQDISNRGSTSTRHNDRPTNPREPISTVASFESPPPLPSTAAAAGSAAAPGSAAAGALRSDGDGGGGAAPSPPSVSPMAVLQHLPASPLIHPASTCPAPCSPPQPSALAGLLPLLPSPQHRHPQLPESTTSPRLPPGRSSPQPALAVAAPLGPPPAPPGALLDPPSPWRDQGVHTLGSEPPLPARHSPSFNPAAAAAAVMPPFIPVSPGRSGQPPQAITRAQAAAVAAAAAAAGLSGPIAGLGLLMPDWWTRLAASGGPLASRVQAVAATVQVHDLGLFRLKGLAEGQPVMAVQLKRLAAATAAGGATAGPPAAAAADGAGGAMAHKDRLPESAAAEMGKAVDAAAGVAVTAGGGAGGAGGVKAEQLLAGTGLMDEVMVVLPMLSRSVNNPVGDM